MADADALSAFCGGRFNDWEEYQLFSRCISGQTVREDGSRRLATHEDGTMDSSILQNPSDPEATFRSKAGEGHRGYVANLEESVGGNGSVITDYRFEQNTYGDSQFLADTLTAMEPSEEPVTIATDDGKTILACPGGIEPVSCGRPYKNGQMRVAFPSACCGNCPYREQCPESSDSIKKATGIPSHQKGKKHFGIPKNKTCRFQGSKYHPPVKRRFLK